MKALFVNLDFRHGPLMAVILVPAAESQATVDRAAHAVDGRLVIHSLDCDLWLAIDVQIPEHTCAEETSADDVAET